MLRSTGGKRVRLYRGLKVSPSKMESVITAHQRHELAGQWRDLASLDDFVLNYQFWHHAAKERARLSRIKRLTTADTRPDGMSSEGWLFACGDLMGAEHYAFHHSSQPKKPLGLVVEIEVNFNALIVDGRDFLYSLAFPNRYRRCEVREAIRAVYGDPCLRHLDRAMAGDTGEEGMQSGCFARVDLACQDLRVVRSHLANQSVIAGRFGTLYRSSFMFRPEEAQVRVVRVWRPAHQQPRLSPDYILHDLYNSIH